MLYPDFNDLLTFKKRKTGLKQISHRDVKSTTAGQHRSPFRGQGLEFDSVREYVPGDDIRRIDWRVTARTGSAHLKIFKEDRERHLVICVDMNAAMRFGTKNTFKSVQAARIAAFLGWQGMASQDRISAYLFGDVKEGIQYFSPRRTAKSFCEILKTLAEPPIEHHQKSIGEVLKKMDQAIPSGSVVYLISDFMDIDESFQHSTHLARLSQKCDLIFVTINDPADASLYPLGVIGFSDTREKAFINTKSPEGRETYRQQWDVNRQEVKKIASGLKIPMIELMTESDIRKDLMLGLKMMARRKKR
jgi:uncharacterized protein (DUF58 family)